MRVLLVVNECNPEWASVPLEGYRLVEALRRRADVTLVTHVRNRAALERAGAAGNVVFIPESRAAATWYRVAARAAARGRIRWNLLHALSYPIYAEFDARTDRQLRGAVARGEFQIVHAFTPVMPRYPYRVGTHKGRAKFVLGPVNGGLPYPAGFRAVAQTEADRWNRLRGASEWLPGYRSTYESADLILCGASHIRHRLGARSMTHAKRLQIVYENGLTPETFRVPRAAGGEMIRLLFVGRLVPYKGADMLLDAVQQLEAQAPGRYRLTIVGDGEDRAALEQQARAAGIAGNVIFAGWVKHDATGPYYGDADIFCFPSIREFGGAVVLEAMAAGLPCLVANYGGPADYVTPETGFTLSVASRAQLVAELRERVQQLANDAALRAKMGEAACARARGFTWDAKAEQIVELYHALVNGQATSSAAPTPAMGQE